MKRVVETELLDELPVRDPQALRSRQDIRRLNAFMGNARIMAAELETLFARHLYVRMVEIGGGDGESLLRVARLLREKWRRVDVTLVDREELLENGTRTEFAQIQWQTAAVKRDVFDWFKEPGAESAEVVTSSLFLHQFSETQLRELFRGAARQASALIAVEPQRSKLALCFSHLVGLLGCNAVTRHDAPVSVRAGFVGCELSALWPDPENWELTERPAGRFSHVFIARRKDWMPAAVSQPIDPAMLDRQTAAGSNATRAQPAGTFPFRSAVNSPSAPTHEP